ncbi:MAG TPA: gluconate 2-dehydrogenase subunit 3 family protein [Polyangiaceae bacterium]|nr:gluconate 2-dehydrogenase subunit 3 family protein [Polyangiaceae bacterium]
MRTPAGHRRLPRVPSSPPAAHSRRELLQYLGGLTAALAVPFGAEGCSSPPAQTGFFTDAERSALGALANAVLPPDDTPGGAALGAVAYIERLLTAFDSADATHPPAIYAGGPFSGRAPYADPNGQPGTTFPPNSFSTFLPLDRVKDAGWRLTLFGSAALPGGAPNESLLGAVVGLRDQVKKGLADAIANAPQPLDQMNQDDIISYLNTGLGIEFRQLVIELVCQGCFAPPEYGGNLNLGGWKLTHFEGDQQPLGYSVWSTAQSKYVERPDAPMTTPDATDPEPLSPDVVALIDNIVSLLGGAVYQP